MKRVGVLLIVVAFVAGMVGCSSESYALAITSTTGGSVTIPGEGTFTYDEGTVVNLTAEAENGYRFVNWTGDVSTVADVDVAATNITMNGSYSIMANFVAVYDLTITSTVGGNVTVPGEGEFTYDAGTLVNLVAVAQEDYCFLNWAGDVDTVGNVSAAITNITMNDSYFIAAGFEPEYMPMIAAGSYHTLGLKSDGTVLAVGNNGSGQCDVSDWTDIVQVAGGGDHTVGVKTDGTVVAVGWNYYGQCNVGSWTDIIQVSAGYQYTVGLKADGTAVAVGLNHYGQCSVGSWTDIIQISAGGIHTVGLKVDGTAVAVGHNIYGQCDVGNWTGITQVEAGGYHTLGVKADATVVAVGANDYGQCDVGDWTDIIQVAGYLHTVGLKSDGTVLAVREWNDNGQCDVGNWTAITQVDACGRHTVGLRSNGTAVAVGHNVYGQCDVDDWDLS